MISHGLPVPFTLPGVPARVDLDMAGEVSRPGPGQAPQAVQSPRRNGRTRLGGGGSTRQITPCAPQEVAMDERLSWDELYPFMDEVKALARGPAPLRASIVATAS